MSRGELFVSDAEGKFIMEMQRGSAERVSEVKWLSDNKTLLFNQTLDGYLNLYTIAADGSAAIKQLTADKRNNRSVILNGRKTMAVYLSGRDEVRIVDLKSFESKTIVKDEIWGFQNSDPGFSPDGAYVLFTAVRNFEQDIFIHNIKQNTTTDLTNTAITEASPVWSPDSKYIYFTSSRLQPSYPRGLQDPRIYRLPLQKLDLPYKMDKYNELFKDDKSDSTKKKDSVSEAIKIDADGILDRIEQIGPSFGAQYLVTVLQDGDKTNVLYVSNHIDDKNALYKTVLQPFESPKTEKINGTDNSDVAFAKSNDKNFVLLNGNIHKLNLDQNKVDVISATFTFRRNLSAEFNQMFSEAWADMQENYYDENFHGLDWNKTKTYYKQFLPYVNNRSDLRVLLNDMLGELNSSHQGFSSFGDDENIALKKYYHGNRHHLQ